MAAPGSLVAGERRDRIELMRSHPKAPIAFAVLVLAAMLVRVSSSEAQGIQTSSIVGTVFDVSGAVVPNVEITLEGSRLIGGPLALTTDASGHYASATLTPGRYALVGRQPGFDDAERHDIDLPVAATLTVDLVLVPSRLHELVEVVEPPSPVVDVRSAAASAHLDQRLLQNLPSFRAVAEVINLAPGVVAGVGFGGTQESNGLYVDGVNLVEVQLGRPYLRLNYDWLQEVEVAAIGAGPEYGQSTGVTANIVLRSGSNRFTGMIDALTTRPSWLARNTDKITAALQREFAPLELTNWWDSSVQVGGPVFRDRLWYFAGQQSLRHSYRPAGYSGVGTTREADDKALVKITGALSPSMRVEGLGQPGAYRVLSYDLGSLTSLEATTDERQPQAMWNGFFRWTPNGRWLLEARNGGYRSDTHDDPHAPGTRNGPAPHRDILTGGQSVSANFFFDLARTQYLTSVNATTFTSSKWGRHDIRLGWELEHADMVNASGYPGGMLFQDQGASPYRVLLWDGSKLTASNLRSAFFGNDAWQMHHVTISAGLRVDMNRTSVPLVRNVFETNPVSPRLGIAWDVLQSHRFVVRAHAGRYYDQAFLGRISTIDVSATAPTITAAVLGPGEYAEISRTTPVNNVAIDPHVKHAFADQLTAGIEWQLQDDTSLEVNFIHRDFPRFIGMVDVGRRWSPTLRRDTGPDDIPDTADDGELFTVYNLDLSTSAFYLYSNPAGAYRRYRGLQVVGRKRFSHLWGAQASYTWSRTTGNVDNGWHTNTGVNDLGTGGGFSNPNRFINLYGKSPYDPREVKILADGFVPAWGGFNLGAVYRYTSGQTWARRAVFRGLTQSFDYIWTEPRGSRRLPAINKLDLRVEKLFPVRRFLRLGLSAEVFNVTNQGVPNSDLFAPIQVFSGPTLGEPLAWIDPRLVRLNLRLTF